MLEGALVVPGDREAAHFAAGRGREGANLVEEDYGKQILI